MMDFDSPKLVSHLAHPGFHKDRFKQQTRFNSQPSQSYKYSNQFCTSTAYITVEDLTDMERMDCILSDLLDDQDNSYDIHCIEQNECYFVIKVEYDNWEDVKDISSTITHLLLQYGIGKFTFGCKAEDLMNEYE